MDNDTSKELYKLTDTYKRRVEAEERGGWHDVEITRDEPNQYGNGTACPLMAGRECMRRRCTFAVPDVDRDVDRYEDEDGRMVEHNTRQTTWTCYATDARPEVDGEIGEKYRERERTAADVGKRKLAELWT